MTPGGNWWDDARCIEIGADSFFPGKGEGTSHGARMAKQVCADCPVRTQCLEWAMVTELDGERYGIWGGTSAAERDRLALARTVVMA